MRPLPAVGVLLLLAGCLGEYLDPVNPEDHAVVFLPSDTAVYIGATLQARAQMSNRFGDVYPSTHIEYSALDQPASATRTGVVTGQTLGRARIVARREELTDTGWVTVVPTGTIAMSLGSDQSFVDVVSLDGSGFRRVIASGQFGGGAPAWLPGAPGLVYQEAIPGGAGATVVYRTDLDGHRTRLLGPVTEEPDEKYPRVSRDGTWVYLRYGREIWRVHPDGTGLEVVTPDQDATHPDPSPDGASVVFTAQRPGPFGVRSVVVIRDLSTGVETPLEVEGLLPRWSPAGDWVAYWSGDPLSDIGSLHLVQPDGTEDRAVSLPGRRYRAGGLDWSPDGAWLLARGDSLLELVEVATGRFLPLPYTAASAWASWMR
jgi:Tol biopolymer transport system component